jgi:hypothetical protein
MLANIVSVENVPRRPMNPYATRRPRGRSAPMQALISEPGAIGHGSLLFAVDDDMGRDAT